MTWPATLPRWASGAGADVVEPAEGKKDIGWSGPPEKPPHETFNWLGETTYDWLAELEKRERPRELETLVADLDVNDIGTLEFPSAEWFEVEPGTWDTGFTGTVEQICCTSEYYIIGNTTEIKRYPRASGSASDVTYAPANAMATLIQVSCSDSYVAVLSTSGGNHYLDLFTIDSGTPVWTYNAGATMCVDVALSSVGGGGARVALTEGDELQLFTQASNVPLVTVNHDATITSVRYCRRSILFCGNDSGGAGDTAAGTNLVKLDLTGTVDWDTPFAQGTPAIARNGNLACDGSVIYVGVTDNDSGAGDLALLMYGFESGNNITFGAGDVSGSQSSPINIGDNGAADPGESYCWEVDDQWLYYAHNGELVIRDKKTLAHVYTSSGLSLSNAAFAFDCDRIYVGGDLTGNVRVTRTPQHGLKMRLIEYASSSDELLPWHHLVMYPVHARSV